MLQRQAKTFHIYKVAIVCEELQLHACWIHYVCIVFFVLCTAFFTRCLYFFSIFMPWLAALFAVGVGVGVGKVKGAPTIQQKTEKTKKNHQKTEPNCLLTWKIATVSFFFVSMVNGKWPNNFNGQIKSQMPLPWKESVEESPALQILLIEKKKERKKKPRNITYTTCCWAKMQKITGTQNSMTYLFLFFRCVL